MPLPPLEPNPDVAIETINKSTVTSSVGFLQMLSVVMGVISVLIVLLGLPTEAYPPQKFYGWIGIAASIAAWGACTAAEEAYRCRKLLEELLRRTS